jgi:hypothetical protein
METIYPKLVRPEMGKKWKGRKWRGLLGWGGDVLGFEEAVQIHVADDLL